MKRSRLAVVLVCLQLLLSGCGRAADSLAEQVSDARAVALSSHAKFRSMAQVLSRSSVTWANAESVRYRAKNNDYRTDSWKVADLDPALRKEIGEFIAGHHVIAVFVGERRVNFLMVGQGISPSGVSVGLILTMGGESGCTEVVKTVDVGRRGVQCEDFGSSTYFYLQR